MAIWHNNYNNFDRKGDQDCGWHDIDVLVPHLNFLGCVSSFHLGAKVLPVVQLYTPIYDLFFSSVYISGLIHSCQGACNSTLTTLIYVLTQLRL